MACALTLSHYVLMRILMTGSRGLVGAATVARLQAEGDDVSEFDIVNGQDVLDPIAVRDAATGCDVILHLAAIDDPPEFTLDPNPVPESVGSPESVLAVTVLGTWHVLRAAQSANHKRVVMMSSVDALGIFLGQRAPDYLPICNDHPTYPQTPYALAKRTAERMCASFTATTGIATLCLRPPGIWTDATFAFIRRRWDEDPLNDRRPFWEYGAFIALSDVVEALRCAIHNPFSGHATLLISSDDAALAEQTSREAAQAIHPSVPWRGGPEFETHPHRTLLDNSLAKAVLDWSPQVSFR